MTLQQVIASGKKFRRGTSGAFKAASEYTGFTLADVNATDYVLAPDVVATISNSLLVQAWDAAAATRSTIATASESRFFADVKAHLMSLGVNIVG